MFPIAIVGAIIGVIATGAKGAEWASDKLDSSKGSGSVGGKAGPTPLTDAQAASFSATLAAQTAGQSLPPSIPVATAPAAVHQSNGTDYAMFDRLTAGTIAYSHIGEHHSAHAGAVTDPGVDGNI